MDKTLEIGGYPSHFHASVAGPFGCDKCFFCGRNPSEGERVWSNCYADIACDTCANAPQWRRRAAEEVRARGYVAVTVNYSTTPVL